MRCPSRRRHCGVDDDTQQNFLPASKMLPELGCTEHLKKQRRPDKARNGLANGCKRSFISRSSWGRILCDPGPTWVWSDGEDKQISDSFVHSFGVCVKVNRENFKFTRFRNVSRMDYWCLHQAKSEDIHQKETITKGKRQKERKLTGRSFLEGLGMLFLVTDAIFWLHKGECKSSSPSPYWLYFSFEPPFKVHFKASSVFHTHAFSAVKVFASKTTL